eukprot:TRINITY_DN4484_c0_g1_i1.p1 TRINITY_DN4484_c0_g1~~TRINITY_DN4484_c0_g1_i1.p1  ORF type:complete len:635 (+),score=147.95 TRINITY_DN4484_c0_g1_i1:162-2066(+)
MLSAFRGSCAELDSAAQEQHAAGASAAAAQEGAARPARRERHSERKRKARVVAAGAAGSPTEAAGAAADGLQRPASEALIRCYSGSWADFGDLDPDDDGAEEEEEGSGGLGSAAADLGNSPPLSPKSRGQAIVGLRGDSPLRDEDGKPMDMPPRPVAGLAEMKKNFSGSCLDLQGLEGASAGTDSPGYSPAVPAGRGFPGAPQGTTALHPIPRACGILEFVGAQNALAHRYGLARGDGQVAVVIGAGGFVGSHLSLQLLQQGYAVRAVFPNSHSGREAAHHLQQATNSGLNAPLRVVHCDLPGPDPAASGEQLDGVLAGAHWLMCCPPSSCSGAALVDTVRVVFGSVRRVAGAGALRRCVLTSSTQAVYAPGDPVPAGGFSAAHFAGGSAEPAPGRERWRHAVRAEHEARAAAAQAGVDLTIIVPGTPIGPLVVPEIPEGLRLLQSLCSAANLFPFLPRLAWCFADVRDVAAAHMLAVQSARAAGQRYIVASGKGAVSAEELARIIRHRHPHLSVPSRVAWDWVTLAVAALHGQRDLSDLRALLGSRAALRTTATRRQLRLRTTSVAQAVTDSVADLIDTGDLPGMGSPVMRQHQCGVPGITCAAFTAVCTICTAALWLAGGFRRPAVAGRSRA